VNVPSPHNPNQNQLQNQIQSRQNGRFAYDGLERVFHEKARLGILTSLITNPDGLLFADLKQLCQLTDGNLNRHLKVLQEEKLVEVHKSFQEGRPHTRCRLTTAGRQRFLNYLNVLEQVIADAEHAAAGAACTPNAGLTPGRKGLSAT